MAIKIVNLMQNLKNSALLIAYSARLRSRVKRSQSSAVRIGRSLFLNTIPNHSTVQS